MNLILRRIAQSDNGTFGVLINDTTPICVTCEDPWHDNHTDISCIPAGNYRCVEHSGARFQNVWELQGVPDRTAILIHSGNTINDTHGCILVGAGFGKLAQIPGVIDSVATLQKLRVMLPDTFYLEIIDAFRG